MSGDSFVGFSSYGNAVGAAEALGQNLTQFLMPGLNYSVSFGGKKTTSGVYSDTCGGVAVYGFPGVLPASVIGQHVSGLPGAVLLGISAHVFNTDWELFTISFTLTTTIQSVVFTVENVPNSVQCIFMDDVFLQLATAVPELADSPPGSCFLIPVTEPLILPTGAQLMK